MVAVSNRRNLDLCLKHGLAGFSNSGTGVWAFVDIREGDYISFLYAARVLNLYRVVKKVAIAEFREAPPWPPVTFRESNKTYFYPFRLFLKPTRELTEAIVRPEFAYVAENLLLRAGYRKTHFQADQTTLQLVSQMGNSWTGKVQPLEFPPHSTFKPRFTRRKADVDIPTICPFNELILQAAIRHRLVDVEELGRILALFGLETLEPAEMEVLSEKAVSEGHVDILVKDAVPIGTARKLVFEAKLARAKLEDLAQLSGYVDEFGGECVGRALIAGDVPTSIHAIAEKKGIRLFKYSLGCNWDRPRTFDAIRGSLQLTACR